LFLDSPFSTEFPEAISNHLSSQPSDIKRQRWMRCSLHGTTFHKTMVGLKDNLF